MKTLLNNQLLLATMAGIGFGIWPMIAGKVKTDPANIIITSGLSLLIIGVIAKIFSGKDFFDFPPLKEYRWLILACMINATAYIGYSRVISKYVEFGTTTYMIIAVSIPILVGYIYGAISLKESISIEKSMGIILILCGIILVKSKITLNFLH